MNRRPQPLHRPKRSDRVVPYFVPSIWRYGSGPYGPHGREPLPHGLPGWIDNDVLAWWSWQNGLIDHEPNDHRNDLYLGVAPFELTCRSFFEARSELLLEIAFDDQELAEMKETMQMLTEHPTIPLLDADGAHICIRKLTSSSEWVLCQLTKEWEWQGIVVEDDEVGEMIPFERDLSVLCDRLEEGTLKTSRQGHLTNVEGSEPEYGVDLWFYPWRQSLHSRPTGQQ